MFCTKFNIFKGRATKLAQLNSNKLYVAFQNVVYIIFKSPNKKDWPNYIIIHYM